jgi:hypothetical protein
MPQSGHQTSSQIRPAPDCSKRSCGRNAGIAPARRDWRTSRSVPFRLTHGRWCVRVPDLEPVWRAARAARRPQPLRNDTGPGGRRLRGGWQPRFDKADRAAATRYHEWKIRFAAPGASLASNYWTKATALRGQSKGTGRDLPLAEQFFEIICFCDEIARHGLKPLGKVLILAVIRQAGADTGLSPQVNCQNHKRTPLHAGCSRPNLESGRAFLH